MSFSSSSLQPTRTPETSPRREVSPTPGSTSLRTCPSPLPPPHCNALGHQNRRLGARYRQPLVPPPREHVLLLFLLLIATNSDTRDVASAGGIADRWLHLLANMSFSSSSSSLQPTRTPETSPRREVSPSPGSTSLRTCSSPPPPHCNPLGHQRRRLGGRYRRPLVPPLREHVLLLFLLLIATHSDTRDVASAGGMADPWFHLLANMAFS